MHEVDANAVAIKGGEEACKLLLEHERQIARVELKQHLVLLVNHDRLVCALNIASDYRARSVLIAKWAHVERDILLLQGFDGLGVDDLRTTICHLYGIHVVKTLNLLGIGKLFGISIEDAIDILPHAHRLCIEDICHDGCRVVRALTAKCCSSAIGSTTDKALTHKYAHGAILNLTLQAHRRSLKVYVSILVALLGEESTTHIYPAVLHAVAIEIVRDDCRRDQLTKGYDSVVPELSIRSAIDGVTHDVTQLLEERVYLLDGDVSTHELIDDCAVVGVTLINAAYCQGLIALLHGSKDTLESICCLTHRRNDDKEFLLACNYIEEVAYTVGILNRSTSKFIYFHTICGFLILFNITTTKLLNLFHKLMCRCTIFGPRGKISNFQPFVCNKIFIFVS